MDRFWSNRKTKKVGQQPISDSVHWMKAFYKVAAWLLLPGAVWTVGASVSAQEPFDRFMTRLKEERLFDLAIVYLDQQATAGTLTVEQTGALKLERALLLQQSSPFQRNEELRAARLDQAEKVFQEFLNEAPDHPRRSEGKLGMGNLLLSRGEKSFTLGNKTPNDPAKLKEAADFFKRSEELFSSTLTELAPKLKELQGARVADEDAAKIELRDRYRNEYSQAQLLTAYAHQRFAECLPSGSDEWKKELAAVEKSYTEIYLNKTRADGLRNLALFYRGQVQSKLGKTPEAMDSFQRIADLTDVPDAMRGLKTRAVRELVILLSSPEQGKFDAAIAVAQPWLDKMTSAEGKDPDWIDLQVVTAETQITASKKLKEAGGGAQAIKNLEDAARRSLQLAARVPGDHQEKARALLASIGADAAAPVVDTKPIKTFAEAVDAAQSKLADMESVGLTVEILKQQLASTQDAAEKQKVEAQIAAALNDSTAEMKNVSALLTKALSLYGPEDSRSRLQEARYLLAYSFLKQDQLWEAATASYFTTRSSAGETWGLQAGMICLNAYQRMLQKADASQKEFIFGQLQGLAEYLLKTWPAAEESQQAANLLVQLTLINGDLEKARSYVAMVPADTVAGGKIRRQLGLSLWDDYNKRLRAAGENPIDPALVASRQTAMDALNEGVMTSPAADKPDVVSVEAALALINLWMIDGKLTEASDLLNNADKGPIALLDKNTDLSSQGTTALRTYQAALQINIAQLATKSDDKAVERIQTMVDKLSTIAGNDEEGKKKLAAVFFRIARDLQQQLEATPDAAARERLANGVGVVLTQLRNSTPDPTTKLWVGQTLGSIAKALKGTPSSAEASKRLAGESVKTLDALRTDPATTPENLVKVRFMMSQAYQTMGQTAEALKLIEEILKQNEMMLDVQVEAARMLQSSANPKDTAAISKAVSGYLPNPKTRKNIVWGWGRISQLTAGKPNMEETFFESRLELARCRYLQAMATTDPELRTKTLDKALTDIKQTLKLYPELGGPVYTERYDKLTRDLQRELKQNVVGLKGLSTK